MASSMATTGAPEQTIYSGAAGLPAVWAEPHWYAMYTCANHEKRVAAELGAREVEHFLPVYRSVRRWKDRRVQMDLPLFPGYVFVRLALRDRLRVLQIPSVARLVGFGGLPTALPDDDMEILRTGLSESLRAEPHPYLQAGKRARVVRGPLAGMDGIVVRRKNRTRLVLSFDLIQRSMAIELDEDDLAPA